MVTSASSNDMVLSLSFHFAFLVFTVTCAIGSGSVNVDSSIMMSDASSTSMLMPAPSTLRCPSECSVMDAFAAASTAVMFSPPWWWVSNHKGMSELAAVSLWSTVESSGMLSSSYGAG